MDPPSAPLVETLLSLGLATAGDLARCRPLVRQFARDLPTFDSVWIDALVRTGILTPYQSRQLYAGQAQTLRIGPWLIQEVLQAEGQCEVFLARHVENRKKATLTHWSSTVANVERAQQRFQELLAKTPRHAECICFPTESYPLGNNWWTVSPSVTGLSVESLRVRRGRFPSEVVHRLACSLTRDLELTHRAGYPHGDLRTANLWISPQGELQLLHPGLLLLVEPGPPLHARHPLAHYDGLAPELIDPGPSMDWELAEVYALGCLLWELLVGRPPFPQADHLLKLAAHRNQRIPSIREWAPETPAILAELVDQMTMREPLSRPRLAAICETLGHVSGTSRRLAAFLSGFESASARPLIRTTGNGTSTSGMLRKSTAAVGISLAIIGVAAGWWWGQQHLSDAVLQPKGASANTSPDTRNPTSIEAPTLLPLPEPDAQGRVQLETGRYAARELTSPADLLILGPTSGKAEIQLGSEPWKLTSQRLLISGVELQLPPDPGPPPVEITTQELVLEALTVRGQHPVESQCFRWSLLIPSDVTGGRLAIRNCAFLQTGNLIELGFPLGPTQIENTLQTGQGSTLTLTSGVSPGARVPVIFNHCTFRDTGPLIRWKLSSSAVNGQLSLQGTETLLMLAPEQALIEFSQGQLPLDWTRSVQIAAAGLILPDSREVVGYRLPSRDFRPLPADQVSIDGLLSGEVSFAGSDLTRLTDSNIRDAQIPLRQAQSAPGVDPALLR